MKNSADEKKIDFKTIEKLIDFFYEIGSLKFAKRQGWISINISGDNCETIGAHCFRTAIIAYYLAKLEGFDDNQAATIGFLGLIHDLEEARIGDITPRQKKYIRADKSLAIKDILQEQWLIKNMTTDKYKSIISDADKLDMIFQAKEYYDTGNKYAFDWIKTGKKNLKTKSARYMAELAENKDSKKWVFDEC